MIRPSANNVFAEQVKKETVTASGLHTSQDNAEAIHMATILKLGSKVTDYKVGEVIVYKPYTATEIKLEGKEYLLIEQEEILGVKE